MKIVSGGHSEVHLYDDKVIKVLNKYENGFNPNLFREINFLNRLDHPNIIKLRDVAETPKTVRLTMDKYDFDLRTLKGMVRRQKRLEMLDELFLPIFGAVLYLNHMQVRHMDINLNNIVYTEGKPPVLIDFSSSMYSFSPDTFFYTVPKHRAPEMKHKIITSTTDLYMLAESAYNWISKKRFRKNGRNYFPDYPESIILGILPLILRPVPVERISPENISEMLGFSTPPPGSLFIVKESRLELDKLKFIRRKQLEHRGLEWPYVEGFAKKIADTGEDSLVCLVLAQALFSADYYNITHLCFLHKVEMRELMDRALRLFFGRRFEFFSVYFPII